MYKRQCIPYPLTSGGNQAFFHMVDYLRHKMSVSILLYPKGQEKKDVEKLKEVWDLSLIHILYVPGPGGSIVLSVFFVHGAWL